MCDPYTASCTIISAIHIVCVCPSFKQKRGTTGWMGATHNMDRTDTGYYADEWGHKHMCDKGKGTYPCFCHACVRPLFSQPYPSLCRPWYVCVAPFNQPYPIIILIHGLWLWCSYVSLKQNMPIIFRNNLISNQKQTKIYIYIYIYIKRTTCFMISHILYTWLRHIPHLKWSWC